MWSMSILSFIFHSHLTIMLIDSLSSKSKLSALHQYVSLCFLWIGLNDNVFFKLSTPPIASLVPSLIHDVLAGGLPPIPSQTHATFWPSLTTLGQLEIFAVGFTDKRKRKLLYLCLFSIVIKTIKTVQTTGTKTDAFNQLVNWATSAKIQVSTKVPFHAMFVIFTEVRQRLPPSLRSAVFALIIHVLEHGSISSSNVLVRKLSVWIK